MKKHNQFTISWNYDAEGNPVLYTAKEYIENGLCGDSQDRGQMETVIASIGKNAAGLALLCEILYKKGVLKRQDIEDIYAASRYK